MTANVNYHDPVMTADGRQLGVAQRIYRTVEDDPIETTSYNEHLKVISFETGENFFIPLEFINDRADGQVSLTLTYREVLNSAFDHMPRYIAYEVGTKQALPA
ncbi:MAG: hypothetical protein ACPG8W_05470 [Candidatus Promineifilaceae bacterium]